MIFQQIKSMNYSVEDSKRDKYFLPLEIGYWGGVFS
jgi:hypothetical protein